METQVTEMFVYLGKVSAGVLALYGLYWSALRWHTYFQFNRFYLLMATLLSLIVPLVTLTETLPAPALPMPVVAETLPYIALTPVSEPVSSINPVSILGLVYVIGVLAMLGRLFWHIRNIMRLIENSEQIKVEGYTIVRLSSEKLSSFSFLNYLVVNSKDLSNFQNLNSTVVTHELVHIRQRHSWDLLWVEFLHALLWFNPVLILYKRSLKEIHEFIADEAATHGDRLTYARALAGYALGVEPQVLTNNFFDISQLKSRIAMLTKNRSSRRVLARYLLVIPILGLMVGLLATRQIEYAQKEETVVKGKVTSAKDQQPLIGVAIIANNVGTVSDHEGKYTIKIEKGQKLSFSHVGFVKKMVVVESERLDVALEIAPNEIGEVVIASFPASPPPPPVEMTVSKKEPVFTVVEQQPEFVGGTAELMRYLGLNLKYPLAARRANVQGKVFVQFVVSDDGSIREPKILQGLGFGCDEEALRVVLNMPNWKPAKQNGKPVAVYYNLPLSFVIEYQEQQSDSKIKFMERDNESVKIIDNNIRIIIRENGKLSGFNQPLYILDGKELNEEQIKNINPIDIDHITIIKGEQAIAIYGGKGINGVVKIITKAYAKISNEDKLNWEETIVLVDDKPTTEEAYKNIKPDEIEAVAIFKDTKTIQKYTTDSTKKAVVLIKLKKQK